MPRCDGATTRPRWEENDVRLLLRYMIIVLALMLAVALVPGIVVEEGNAWFAAAVMALILALINTFVRPVLAFLSCGCIVATAGLFLLVINALTLWLSSQIAQGVFGVGFVVEGFWPAFWGSLVVSIVTLVLTGLTAEDGD